MARIKAVPGRKKTKVDKSGKISKNKQDKDRLVEGDDRMVGTEEKVVEVLEELKVVEVVDGLKVEPEEVKVKTEPQPTENVSFNSLIDKYVKSFKNRC